MRIRVPYELLHEMEVLTEELNLNYKTLMNIAELLSKFGEVNGLTEDNIHVDDLKIIEQLENTVDKFRDL